MSNNKAPGSSTLSTTKILIDTLTEVPDLQLLDELFGIIQKTSSLVIPDLRKLFDMIAVLYQTNRKTKKIESKAMYTTNHNNNNHFSSSKQKSTQDKIIYRTFQLHQHINTKLLKTQIQISWQHIGKSLILLCGEQDSTLRKKSRAMILQIMSLCNNNYMVLERLFYDGMEDQMTIVVIYSIKLIFKIFEMSLSILSKKSCVSLIKLILEKMIRLTNSQHMELQKNANHFLHRLFFLKIEKMDEILQRLDPFYLRSLESIWEKNKENLLYKNEQQQSEGKEQLKQIKYEHLPLINDKFFGVYEPFILKNMFNPDTTAALKYSVKQFKNQFQLNQDRLLKYVNSICKIIMKMLPQKHMQMLQLLEIIVSLPGITNIINVAEIIDGLLGQLDTENVLYRRQLRSILQKLNHLCLEIIIKKYEAALQKEDLLNQVITQEDWLKVYEILLLIENWSQIAEAIQCYPPTLDFVVRFISFNIRKTKVIKVRDQCEKLLYFILEKFSGYRENLEDYFDSEMVGYFEDILQQRKPYVLGNDKKSQESKETFMKEYEEERRKFLKQKQVEEGGKFKAKRK